MGYELKYPIAINGKTVTGIRMPMSYGPEEAEETVMQNEEVKMAIAGRIVKKFIFARGAIINIVI